MRSPAWSPRERAHDLVPSSQPAAWSTARGRSRFASTAGAIAALPAIPSPPRSSPRASGSSADPSSTIARAASSPPGRRSRTRLVELRTGAHREPNTRATVAELYRGARGAEPEPLAVAALRRDGAEHAPRARAGGRLLLQDLHVAGELLGEGLRAADPARRGPRSRRDGGRIRTATKRPSPSATCSSSAAGPPGCQRRLRPAAPARASSSATRISASAAGFFPTRGRSQAVRRRSGSPHALADLADLPEVRLMPRTTVFGVYDHGTYGAVERVARSSPRAAAAPAAPARPGASSRSAPCSRPARSNGRSSLPATTRPESCSPAPCGRYLNRYGVLPGREAAIFSAGDDGWASVRDLAAAGAQDRRHRRSADATSTRRSEPWPRASARASLPAPWSRGRAAARR